MNYLSKVLVFWYLILPFSFEASNSERPSLLQKLLPLHFIAKITALCFILVTGIFDMLIIEGNSRKSAIKSVTEDKQKIPRTLFGVVHSSIRTENLEAMFLNPSGHEVLEVVILALK